MVRRVILAALAVALLAPGVASAALVYQRGASKYDHPVVVSARSDGSYPLVLAHGYAPTLSPDGRLVAYFKGSGAESLYVEPVRGGRARRLASGSHDSGSRIAWTPDSRRMVVARPSGAYLVDLDGNRRVLTESHLFWSAAISPDGRRIVVEKDLECDHCFGDLFAYRADAPGERSLGQGWSPVWGPGGLAFGRRGRVVVRHGVRGGIHTVLHSRRTPTPIDWSDDGRRLLVAEIVSGSAPSWTFRAVVLRPGHGHPVVIPYTFKDVNDLSDDGREVLGTSVIGQIVRVSLDGTERVLAARGNRPNWSH